MFWWTLRLIEASAAKVTWALMNAAPNFLSTPNDLDNEPFSSIPSAVCGTGFTPFPRGVKLGARAASGLTSGSIALARVMLENTSSRAASMVVTVTLVGVSSIAATSRRRPSGSVALTSATRTEPSRKSVT